MNDLDSLGKLAVAPNASDGSNCVFSGFEKLLSNVLANLASSLMDILSVNDTVSCKAEMCCETYSHNGHTLDAVGEACRLIFGVFD